MKNELIAKNENTVLPWKQPTLQSNIGVKILISNKFRKSRKIWWKLGSMSKILLTIEISATTFLSRPLSFRDHFLPLSRVPIWPQLPNIFAQVFLDSEQLFLIFTMWRKHSGYFYQNNSI